MTHTLANGIRICTVDCPEGAFTFQLYGATSADELRFLISPTPGKFKQHKTLIPPGNWTLLGRFDDITEETWKGVMEMDYFDGIGYQYANYSIGRKWTFGKRFNTATESARSLIPGNPVVLIEKNK